MLLEIVGRICFQNIYLDVYGSMEEPFFLSTDIAKALEWKDDEFGYMLESLADNEKLHAAITRGNSRRTTTFVTEGGLYELLMLSRRSVAKRFKGVIKHVLKSLQKANNTNVVGWFDHMNDIAYEQQFEENFDLEKGDWVDGYWGKKGTEHEDLS